MAVPYHLETTVCSQVSFIKTSGHFAAVSLATTADIFFSGTLALSAAIFLATSGRFGRKNWVILPRHFVCIFLVTAAGIFLVRHQHLLQLFFLATKSFFLTRHHEFFSTIFLITKAFLFFLWDIGTFCSHLSSENRYFNSNHELFQTLNSWLLCLNLTSP